MAFNITLGSAATVEGEIGRASIEGRIELGTDIESFSCAIGFWSPTDYRTQWASAVERVVNDQLPACLVTSIDDSATTEFLMWWLLYPDGTHVKVQNAMLFYEHLASPLDTMNLYEAMPPHRVRTEDDEEISEWLVPISDLKRFLRRARDGSSSSGPGGTSAFGTPE